MTKRAQSMELLYDEMVKELRAVIKRGDATAAHLSVARQALHDAGISLHSDGPGAPTSQLRKALEDLDEEEDRLQ